MNIETKSIYTSQLSNGLGLIEETGKLLDLWQPGMTTSELHKVALESGHFPMITARRLLNIVKECFAPRYLVNGGAPAAHLKILKGPLSTGDLNQFFLLFTSRANAVLADFIRGVYWERYAAGHSDVSNQDAEIFVRRAIAEGKVQKSWAEKTIRNVAGYVTGCCADYGLLERGHKMLRRIQPFRIAPEFGVYLAYDLHTAGLGDNALLGHPDWQLYGLAADEVRDELKRLALQGHFIFQAAGEMIRITWKYQSLEELCHVLAEG